MDIQMLVTDINDLLWEKVLIVVLILGGIWFTVRMGFVQFRMLPEMVRLLFVKSIHHEKGKVSSFQAFAIGTAARVGTGNIAGVSTAIALGGPGAVFWMWIMALIGAASAFVESSLAQLYKVHDGKAWRGGPAYYIERGLGKRWLGIVFAVLITASFGFAFNSVQANTIALSLQTQFQVDTVWIGLGLAVVTGLVIFGGIRSISTISGIIVPIMAGGYLLISFWVVLTNLEVMPDVFASIFSEGVLGFRQLFGGVLGAMVLQGIRRGLFSNEAGMGSAPNAAATAEVSHPAIQGLIQALSVFVDTLFICSATAMIVLVSGVEGSAELQGIELAREALLTSIGPIATTIMTVAIVLFAFSSIVANYYYGETNIEFISERRVYLVIYRVLVIGMIWFGTMRSAALVWSIADIFMGFMALVNLYAIFRLSKLARRLLDDYVSQKREGKEPEFHHERIEDLPGRERLEAWGNEKEREDS